MNTRIAIALSLAVFGACATDADIETDLETASTVTGGRGANNHEPILDQLWTPECGNGSVYVPVVQQVEVRWLATACYGPNEVQLEVGGVPVLKATAGGDCTCLPGVRSERITDQDVLKMIDGNVDLEFSAPGATLLAWAEITIVDQMGAHEFTLFDMDGPNSTDDVANLCQAGSIEDGRGALQLQMGEQCDDGNNVDGDGCSATCMKE
jgi:cysteine-rich repeat protein